MEVRLEHTEGLGGKAEVWLAGDLLEVCDGISPPGVRTRPGVIEGVRFEYVTIEDVGWEQSLRGNPSRKKTLQHVRGWSYEGYGRVTDVTPPVVDFGLLKMADPRWTTDDRLIGRYVKVHIDRIEMRPVGAR